MVRFQLPQLRTEVIRLDEEPVLKTGGRTATCGFESHGFRSERMGSWSNRKTPAPHAGNPGADVMAAYLLPMQIVWVRLPQGTLEVWVGSSAAERVPVKYRVAGSSPARPSVD